jgi:hypothetical protein
LGGKALSEKTISLMRDDYYDFLSFLMPKLQELVPNANFCVVPSYEEKKYIMM